MSIKYANGAQKGPGCDVSMLIAMKRQSILLSEAKQTPGGLKAVGAVVDSQHTRGFSGGVLPVFMTPGARLGFLKTY